MTINQSLTITLLLCALLMAGYIDGDSRKHIASYCDMAEPVTRAEQAKFSTYCGE